MSTSKYTSEPWHVCVNAKRHTFSINNPFAQLVADDLNEANAARIVECVNAFAGVENPADFPILGLVAENREFERELRDLRDWKAQAQNGFRLMGKAHELLKAEHDALKAENEKMLEALEGMLSGTTLEFSQLNGFGEQRKKASEVYLNAGSKKFFIKKPLKARTTTDETSWEENRL
jgi:hypothetical protein